MLNHPLKCTSAWTLQWIFQQITMIEKCFNFLNIYYMCLMNLFVESECAYIEKCCFASFGEWCCLQHGMVKVNASSVRLWRENCDHILSILSLNIRSHLLTAVNSKENSFRLCNCMWLYGHKWEKYKNAWRVSWKNRLTQANHIVLNFPYFH